MKLPAHELKGIFRMLEASSALRIAAREMQTRVRETGDVETEKSIEAVALLFESSIIQLAKLGVPS